MRHRLVVVDDFYDDPDAMRSLAVTAEYREPADAMGWRTQSHFPSGVRSRVERALGRRIRVWRRGSRYWESHGVFFVGLSRGRRREEASIHADDGSPRAVIGVVYLTPDAPRNAGTSFWSHRSTGLTHRPGRAEARRVGVRLPHLYVRLERDATAREKWEELDRVANVYNRAVFFNPAFFHSATRHFGATPADGRVYQCFHFEL